ncbi:MAG TPA: DUF1127 domain-containing protein [Alphaproteobacteria bacterium]|nr:DUF1127 domain-containing protein [Alphaproteobacteria bacterium]
MSTPVSKTRETASPIERLGEPEHWSSPAEVDAEALMAYARGARDKALAGTLLRLGRGAARLWRKTIMEPVARWEARERTMRELSSMRPHELAELGIGPGMIPYVASGKFRTDRGAVVSGSAVANENSRTPKVA